MDGDKAENQDDFLTRMSGIVRLFATICLTQPPPKGLFGSNDLDDGKIVGLFSLAVNFPTIRNYPIIRDYLGY